MGKKQPVVLVVDDVADNLALARACFGINMT